MRHPNGTLHVAGERNPTCLVPALLLLLLGIGGCGDDNGTGPSQDCLEEIEEQAAAEDMDMDIDAIPFGGTRSGSLTPSDAQNPEGQFIDLWVFDLDDDERVQIDVTSDDFDTIVVLFEGIGLDDMADDDDGGSGTNSRIEMDLDDGCYAVAVSSFFSGETGDYSIAVEGD